MAESSNDPIDMAFRNIMKKIYLIDNMEKAEKELRRFLSGMDKDIKDVLLERRKKFCKNPMQVIELISLQGYLESTDPEKEGMEYKLVMAKELIQIGLLLQCIFYWTKISNNIKAHILAPLYKASYAYELALREEISDPIGSINEKYLDESIELASYALDRAEEIGLLDELRDHIKRSLENITSSMFN